PQDDTLINRARCPARVPHMMAAGLPIVAEDIGEAGAYIAHGQSGWLVPAGNDEAFIATACEAVRDKAARVQIGKGSAARARERFAWSRLAEELERFYEQIWRRRTSRYNAGEDEGDGASSLNSIQCGLGGFYETPRR
ncbi:MAG: glycosyltransferase, partial [Anaerolineae bacterium]